MSDGTVRPRELVDSFGRVHRDLRISVTDRCNFRCTYCMPEEGMRWQPREEILTFEEIHRVAQVFVDRFGIESIRLTGGEPLVRAHLPRLVERLGRLGVELALTTNGSTLASCADELHEVGLTRINVSLDSLRADRFAEITKRDALDSVLAGIDAAVRSGLSPVKVNVVVSRGVNDDELLDFVRFGRDRGVTVRFIEFMPLDAQGEWRRSAVVSAAEIVERVGEEFPLEAISWGSEPAHRYRFVDGGGEIGVIPTVTEAFCSRCDRVRLTADGKLRNCLFASDEQDLRALLRSGADDDEVAEAIAANVAAKSIGHQIGQVQFIRPSRSMSQIGG
jgi:cyclic pyranopterin phosphate synthase